MSLDMYAASVPVFQRQLKALGNVLDKSVPYAAARKIPEGVLLQTRLFPDMFPLVRQVQIASDFAKNATALLAGVTPPKIDDNEASLADCRARVDRTLAYVAEFKRDQIDGSEGREITLKLGGNSMTFKGEAYLLHFAMPNFYFHCTTAYAILRHVGLEVGKRDFIGTL
jgi:hypothetical protein